MFFNFGKIISEIFFEQKSSCACACAEIAFFDFFPEWIFEW